MLIVYTYDAEPGNSVSTVEGGALVPTVMTRQLERHMFKPHTKIMLKYVGFQSEDQVGRGVTVDFPNVNFIPFAEIDTSAGVGGFDGGSGLYFGEVAGCSSNTTFERHRYVATGSHFPDLHIGHLQEHTFLSVSVQGKNTCGITVIVELVE